jgi:hypothetical protein
LYGLLAEFQGPEELLKATQQAYDAGFRSMDAFSPFPVEGLAEALGMRHTWLSVIILGGGIVGGVVGFSMQYYSSVFSYPINSGGKPFNSWPAFIPVTFELTILFAALAAVFGMLALNGLPMPYHPNFNVESFSRASRDKFFLLIEAEDPIFGADDTRRFLETLEPVEVSDVEP